MTCSAFNKILADGQPLPTAARDHLAACAGCRALQASLNQFDDAMPSLDAVQDYVAQDLAPVSPLPSNRALTLLFAALFFAFALSAAIPFGYLGLHALSTFQKVAIYGAISTFAFMFSTMLVPAMIPGAKLAVNPFVFAPVVLGVLGFIALAMFDNVAMNRFVPLGIRCFLLGSICAIASGTLVWLLLRLGFVTSPLTSGLTAGFFAGLIGLAVLELHCPILNAPHILVWHLGVIVFASLAGIAVAWLSQTYRRPSRLK